MNKSEMLTQKIRGLIIFFIIALILSGITAFALESELAWLLSLVSSDGSGLSFWIGKVYGAVSDMNARYPFLAYGYDWLAFAHIVIAVAFAGPLMDPVKNKWIILFGMIACGMIFPLAFIAGYVRGIPFYWQLIDCSFGAIGIIPLAICYKMINRLEDLKKEV